MKKRLIAAAAATMGLLTVTGSVAWADSHFGSGSSSSFSPEVALVSINGHAPGPNDKVRTITIKGDTGYLSDGSTIKLNNNGTDASNFFNRVSKTVSLDSISATVNVASGTDVEIHKLQLSSAEMTNPSPLDFGKPFDGSLAYGVRDYYGPYHLNGQNTQFESVAWESGASSTFETGLLDTSNDVLYYVTTTGGSAGSRMDIQWTTSNAGDYDVEFGNEGPGTASYSGIL